MKWYLIKGGLIIFPLFIAIGLIGNLVGLISLTISNKVGKATNDFLKISIWISFFIGAIGFIFMGMFYASYTLSLTSFMTKWLAIVIGFIFIIIVTYFSHREVLSLGKKTTQFSEFDFDFYEPNTPYQKHSQVVNQYVLSGFMLLLPSYIFFLIFNGLADKLSFGFVSYLISLIK